MRSILGAPPRGRHVTDADLVPDAQLRVICTANATRMAMPQSKDRKMSMRVLTVASLEATGCEATT